jgi:hypothetical protein
MGGRSSGMAYKTGKLTNSVHQVDTQLTFVVQGDKITETGISKHVKAKLQQRQLQRPWKAQFVFSTAPSDQLPSSVARENVQNLCIIEANIENVSRTLHNQHWWNRGRRYESAALDVKLIPGSADLKFQLLHNNRVINNGDDSVEVTWEAATKRPAPNINDLELAYN